MKKLYLLFFVIFIQESFAQNTFPTSGNAGVGTTTPIAPFEVWGSSGILGRFRSVNGIYTENSFLEFQNGRGIVGYDGTLSGIRITTSDNTKPIVFGTSVSSSIGEIARFTGSGRLGISTTSPLSLLHISGNVGNAVITLQRPVYGAGGALGSLGFANGVGNYISSITAHHINTDSTEGVLVFRVGKANSSSYSLLERMRIDKDGGVGVATSLTTGYGLRVSKKLTVASNNTGFGIQADGQIQKDITTTAIYFNTIASTVADSFKVASAIHYAAQQGAIGVGSGITSQYGFYVGGSLTGATNNYGIFSGILAGPGRWNLYLSGTANNYINGNLSIGSTSLTGNSFRVTKPITGATTSIGIRSDGQIQPDVTGAAYNFRSDASVASGFALPLPALLHYSAIQSSFASNVDYQVGFNADASISGGTNNYGFRGLLASGTGKWNLYMSGTANNYLNGNLGIGTTTPTARLDVRSATSSASQTNPNISARGVGNSFEFGHPNVAGYVSTIGANYTNGRPFLCFNCEAGTTNDTYKTRGIIGTIITPDLLGGLAFGRIANSNADNQIATTDFILKNGQIGVGTANIPTGYKLAIAGDVIAEKIKVKKQLAGAWPDYVFSSTYKLPSLEEVEKFTKANKHLPEIPSGKEIEKEGQDLGEMNRLLLKKVEELTLYLIEERKSNLEQISQIKELQKEVNQLKKIVK